MKKRARNAKIETIGRSLSLLRPLCKMMLIFACAFLSAMQGIVLASSNSKEKSGAGQVEITTKMSLIHVGSNDSFNPTSEGVEAGRLLLDALEKKNNRSAVKALQIYKKIIPRENYGGEYTALQWFAECLIESEKKRDIYLSNTFNSDFYHFFCNNDHALLKEYLKRKYKLENIGDEETMEGHNRQAWLEDTILFNNPRREQWEKTSEFLKIMSLHKGMVIADVGAGPGYYSVKFAKKIGGEGKVYAIDTVSKHLDYIERLKQKLDLKNIMTIHTDGKTIGIPGQKVDAVFLCSLYHNIYGMSTLSDRDTFLDSIKNALKDNGRLYLFDNGLVPLGTLPYHGPYVAKELVIGQLKHYGFNLVAQYQPVQQRYALVFEKAKTFTSAK
jgi:ubiquinone/menaquinone biosynthesis C-methylase UbiE